MAKKTKPRAPVLPLTGKQKRYLRALAHSLKPLVQIGHQGLTPGVVAALDAALEQHELVKLKVSGEAEVDASEVAPAIEKGARCQLAQHVGHTLVFYRRREREPKIELPRPRAKARTPIHRPEADGEDDLE